MGADILHIFVPELWGATITLSGICPSARQARNKAHFLGSQFCLRPQGCWEVPNSLLWLLQGSWCPEPRDICAQRKPGPKPSPALHLPLSKDPLVPVQMDLPRVSPMGLCISQEWLVYSRICFWDTDAKLRVCV